MKTRRIRTKKAKTDLLTKIKNREDFNVEVKGVFYTHISGMVTKLQEGELYALSDGKWQKC